MIRRLLVLAILTATTTFPVRAEDPAPLRVMLANVGNSNVWCQPYAFKLCFREVEERVAAGIRASDPDIVGLIEVMPDDRCAIAYAGLPEPDPQKVCSPIDPPELEWQAQRLVGPGYSIACDNRFGWDCIAVRDGLVAMSACDGPACFDARGLETAPPIPGCDSGFTVTATEVTASPAGAFRLVLAHPDSGFISGEAGRACRILQLEQMFALAGDGAAFILGDLNMDPYRWTGGDVDLWHEHVGEGKRFGYHSGVAEHDPPHITHFAGESSNLLNTGMMLPTVEDPSGVFARTTIDHVVSDFLAGVCVTLGETPGTARLDGGAGGGMDHRALDCLLGT